MKVEIEIPDGDKCYVTEKMTKQEAPFGGFKVLAECPLLNHARTTCLGSTTMGNMRIDHDKHVDSYCNGFKENLLDYNKCERCRKEAKV